MFGWFKKQGHEKRSSGTGYTADIIASREAYISGRQGIAELTGTVQACVNLWEGALSLADVVGTDLLTRRNLGLTARALALRGEAVFLIEETGLVACSDWDISTRNGRPIAYRLQIPEISGGRSQTALAGEVLHFAIGRDISAPYFGQAPLRRAQLTAGMLQAVETALAEVFDFMPLGSQIVPQPESEPERLSAIGRGFRGKRGRVVLVESVNVSAAGGPQPNQDWKPFDATPDISKAMTKESLQAARDSINMVFGVLPGLSNPAATGPIVREAQRHLTQYILQPIAACIAEEASEKLGADISLDVMRPVQAFDTGGRARAMSAIIGALAQAKESGVDSEKALKLVNWDD